MYIYIHTLSHDAVHIVQPKIVLMIRKILSTTVYK